MRLLIVTLFCICFISLFIIILSFVTPLKKYDDTKDVTQYNAQLYFKPQNIFSACDNASHSAKIALLSNSDSLQSAQIELSYNPKIFYNVSITPSSPNVLGAENNVDINEVRNEYGRLSFAISANGIRNNTDSFELAILTFSAYPQATSSSASITFLNKSNVQDTSSRTSILTETLPLTIHCN